MTTPRRGPDAEDVRIFAALDEPGPATYLLLAWSLLAAALVVSVAMVFGVQALLAHL